MRLRDVTIPPSYSIPPSTSLHQCPQQSGGISTIRGGVFILLLLLLLLLAGARNFCQGSIRCNTVYLPLCHVEYSQIPVSGIQDGSEVAAFTVGENVKLYRFIKSNCEQMEFMTLYDAGFNPDAVISAISKYNCKGPLFIYLCSCGGVCKSHSQTVWNMPLLCCFECKKICYLLINRHRHREWQESALTGLPWEGFSSSGHPCGHGRYTYTWLVASTATVPLHMYLLF